MCTLDEPQDIPVHGALLAAVQHIYYTMIFSFLLGTIGIYCMTESGEEKSQRSNQQIKWESLEKLRMIYWRAFSLKEKKCIALSCVSHG